MGEGDAALLGWGLLVVVPGLERGGIWDGASLLAQPLLRCVALGLCPPPTPKLGIPTALSQHRVPAHRWFLLGQR